jgi:membrane protein YdbS with pleckstrin-like domain
MVAADALAIIVGAIAGKHLPERLIQLTAAALFLAFGVGMLVGGIFPAAPIPVVVGSAVAVVVLFTVVLRAMPKRLRPASMRTEPASLTVTVEPDSDQVPDVR